MKRILVLFAAAGIAAGAFSATVNLSTLSGNKILADGDIVTGVLSGLGNAIW